MSFEEVVVSSLAAEQLEATLTWTGRQAKVIWGWISEPLIVSRVARSSYLWWWGVSTFAFGFVAAAASASVLPGSVHGASLLFLLSSVPTWLLAYSLFIFLGEDWFHKREAFLVLTSRPEKPAGPSPVYLAGIPLGAAAVLMLASWVIGIEPLSSYLAMSAVLVGAVAALWGAASYAIVSWWAALPFALLVPAAASALTRPLALATAGDQGIERELFVLFAPLVSNIVLGWLLWRIISVREANVKAWAELNNLLPKLAVATTAGVLSDKYSLGQLARDLKRVGTPVELIRPVWILVGTVLLTYRPWFLKREQAPKPSSVPPPDRLVAMEVLTPRGQLRSPWKLFLPSPRMA